MSDIWENNLETLRPMSCPVDAAVQAIIEGRMPKDRFKWWKRFLFIERRKP